MDHFADPHNFGQRVLMSERGFLGKVFQKPRSLFWEWIFFGEDSPLREVLQETFPLPKSIGVRTSFAEVALQLKVCFENPSDPGCSVAVVSENEGAPPSERDVALFGVLLSYCYALGLQDLHIENVVRRSTHLQVVDAEMVLSRLLLPAETLLLPFRDIPFEKSALSLLFRSREQISIDALTLILSGFVSGLACMLRIAEPLRIKLDASVTQNSTIPVRVILRNTSRYRNWQADGPTIPYFPEELEQLRRGDIPYFFKYVGSQSLYYYISPEGDFREVRVPEAFQSAVERVGVHPRVLLSEDRIRRELLPQGLLILLRQFLPSTWTGKLQIDSVEIQASKQELAAVTPWGTFTSSRERHSQAHSPTASTLGSKQAVV